MHSSHDAREEALASITRLVESISARMTVVIEWPTGRAEIIVPMRPEPSPVREGPPGGPPADRERRPCEPAQGCGADVLRVLRDAGCRLTVPEIMQELADRDLEHSQRSVERWLQKLREIGLVDHDSEARPAGYGTPCKSESQRD